MKARGIAVSVAALAIYSLLGNGCDRRKMDQAPAGFAIVREHTIYAPRNNPPITSTLDYTITEIDGAAVTRERIPPWVDLQPGALMAAGAHKFKALVAPHVRPPNFKPVETLFAATVESGKVYFLVDKDSAPILVEDHPKDR